MFLFVLDLMTPEGNILSTVFFHASKCEEMVVL